MTLPKITGSSILFAFKSFNIKTDDYGAVWQIYSDDDVGIGYARVTEMKGDRDSQMNDALGDTCGDVLL